MAVSPYDGLPDRAFWRTAVASRGPGRLRGLYTPRFRITRDTPIFTAGSCFAQHVHSALKSAGFAVIEAEPVPDGVDHTVAARFFYGTFSARFGNIYNPRHFLNLLREAAGDQKPAHPVWTRNGRFYDALRPNVDPDGHRSAGSVIDSRLDHLSAFADAVIQARVVIFTLGLTETWHDKASGTVYPTAPGVIADAPNGADIGFLNLGHDAIVADVRAILCLLRAFTPEVKLVLTVAPGPLVATASGDHVLTASTASKAILRAAAATLTETDPDIDYFPSYEIITNPAAKGAFFQPNLRQPTPRGVSVVIKQFMAAHDVFNGPATNSKAGPERPAEDDNAIVCEEALNDPAAGGAKP
ncbi:MAG: GSCFA domain-containing protein [Paracoccaceae bacterium]